MTSMPLHPACALLEPLVGLWRGEGEGWYPTIDDFRYVEELAISHVGKPFLALAQKTRDASTDEPLHTEVGYLRPQPDGSVELVLAQPSGIVEIDVGTAAVTGDGLELGLESVAVHGTPSSKSVTDVRRRLEVSGDELVSEVWMAAVGIAEPEKHLRAVLHRL